MIDKPLNDAAIGELIAAWALKTVGAAERPDAGTIHQTWLVPTDAGMVVVRAYRYSERAPIEREHAVIALARTRGLPAVAPLPLPDSATILAHTGHFYALFPYAPGRQVVRAALGAAEATAMGACLAELHHGLADLPAGLLAPRTLQVDRAATIAEIERLVERARRGSDPHDAVVLHCLLGQSAFVESLPGNATVDLTGLVFQPLHGDYTETNVFFQDGVVSAIIDWDQAYLAPRAWEVVRTLHLAFGFDVTLARPFLAAYRAVAPLAWGELDQAAAAYGVMRAHDTWLAQWIYDRGDDRVRRFLSGRGFVAVESQWAALRRALDVATI
jgi:homoserine kinase type II